MSPSVVVVGSFVQDLTFLCSQFPQTGETTVGKFITGPGGKGSNQAVAAARAGARTRFIGAVGRDAFAAGAADFHRREKIDSRLIPTEQPTATAGILVNESGQNQIIVALGASAALRPTDVPNNLLRGSQLVITQHESNLAVNASVFRQARKLGVTTLLNPAPMRPDFDASVLRDVDILIPNESEFVALAKMLPSVASLRRSAAYRPFTPETFGHLKAEAIHRLCRAFGVPIVIVTLGQRGCLVSLPDRFEFVRAFIVKAVDTTGAGDAFVGGFACGWVEFKRDAIRAARFANAVAALSVTQFGTAPSMPTRKAIDAFLRKQGR
jgi:ribokinase